MKIKLGDKEINPKRVRKVSRVGSRIAHIQFKTGESIKVVCGVCSQETGFVSYSGSYEQLKEFIDKHIN